MFDKRFFFPGVLLVYLVFLAYAALSSNVGKLVPPGVDKVLHFVEFFILAILIYFSIDAFGFDKIFIFVSTFLVALFIALLSEFIQLWFTKGRVFSWFDFVADALGICFALLLLVVYEWMSSKQLF
jgi:VanZ family protein